MAIGSPLARPVFTNVGPSSIPRASAAYRARSVALVATRRGRRFLGRRFTRVLFRRNIKGRTEVLLSHSLSIEATLAQERWRKSVDTLWREVRYYRDARLADRERERAERRLRNLRRIVRRALSEYHRLAVERQNALSL